jgi:hypothetical protein
MADKGKAWGAVLVCGLIVATMVFFTLTGDNDGSTVVPAPEPAARTETVARLAQASAAQNICYGWRLQSSQGLVSAGSNLGDGATVDGDPVRCPTWIEIQAWVRYTDESSESPDTAAVGVAHSAGIAAPSGRLLERFGLDDNAFIDDPAWAICQAAMLLPLLAAEAGLAEPVPEAATGPQAEPAPLPEAGSDFWRARWISFAIAGFLLLLAGTLLLIARTERRAEQRAQHRVPAR